MVHALINLCSVLEVDMFGNVRYSPNRSNESEFLLRYGRLYTTLTIMDKSGMGVGYLLLRNNAHKFDEAYVIIDGQYRTVQALMDT